MNKAAEAAQALLALRAKNKKSTGLNADISPSNLTESFAIHAEMIKQIDDTVGGWKCLLPIADDKMIAAPIFNKTIHQGDVCPIVPDKGVARIEPEIAFVLGQDLPARDQGYTEIEIDNAIGSCHMALELMQNRFEADYEPSFYEKLADCLVNQGMFIGPEIDKALAYQADKITIEVNQNGSSRSFNGFHPNELPQKPLYWFINYMSKQGISFNKGQAIITGSYAGIIEVTLDCECHITYQGLGEYTVELATKTMD